MTKRKLAAEWTASGLIESGQGRATFWTFTTPVPIPPREMGVMWNTFLTRLRQYCPELRFFRVIEPHKSGFQWHYHVLFDRWFSIDLIRSLSGQVGFGFVFAVKVKTNETAGYLVKYITKASRSPALKGVRLWSCSRACPGRVRIRDIEVRWDGKTFAELVPPWAIPEDSPYNQKFAFFRFALRLPEWAAWQRAVLSAIASAPPSAADILRGFLYQFPGHPLCV